MRIDPEGVMLIFVKAAADKNGVSSPVSVHLTSFRMLSQTNSTITTVWILHKLHGEFDCGPD